MAKVTTAPKNYWLTHLLAAMLVLLPFHATLTVWLASNFGHYTLFRLWIEAAIAVLFVGVVYIVSQQKALFANKQARWLWWLSLAYVGLHIVIGALALSQHGVNLSALGEGLVLNLRLVAIFWIAAVIASQNQWLGNRWDQILLWPAAIVVAFGLLQHFVLPADFLRHFGYGPNTILPYETVNHNQGYIRVMSTLRGANPLGAYLVLIVAALAALWLKFKRQRAWLSVFFVATIVVLFYSYSRSALLGAGLTVATVIWLGIKNEKLKLGATLGLAALLIIGGTAVLLLRNNIHFEDVLLHTDTQTTISTNSDQNHVGALETGLKDVAHHPLGSGPGTAGPASYHNNHPARIAENYYVQLAQEVGIVGAAIFIAINIVVAQLLWHKRKDPLAITLFASLIGISFINLLSHAWTDDTLAVLWWALAGIALSGAIIKTTHGTQKT